MTNLGEITSRTLRVIKNWGFLMLLAGIALETTLYKKVIKRGLDFFLALLTLFLLAPAILVIAVLIAIKLGRPILFTQVRPGYKGKLFTIYKFRTMRDKTDAQGNQLPDKDRMTKFGKMLRSHSLDELPELINIIKGDMSIVGPRPLLKEYLPLYNEYQMKRHDVRPGLTGLAQISGRNATSWEDRFNYDVRYVNDVSFMLDVKIMLITMKKVFRKEGISSRTSVTMEKFKGNLKSDGQ